MHRQPQDEIGDGEVSGQDIFAKLVFFFNHYTILPSPDGGIGLDSVLHNDVKETFTWGIHVSLCMGNAPSLTLLPFSGWLSLL